MGRTPLTINHALEPITPSLSTWFYEILLFSAQDHLKAIEKHYVSGCVKMRKGSRGKIVVGIKSDPKLTFPLEEEERIQVEYTETQLHTYTQGRRSLG